jgi:hypothetical protein
MKRQHVSGERESVYFSIFDSGRRWRHGAAPYGRCGGGGELSERQTERDSERKSSGHEEAERPPSLPAVPKFMRSLPAR